MSQSTEHPTAEPVAAERTAAAPPRTERIPADLVETAEGWQVRLALPGVAESDVEVRVERGTLVIRATRPDRTPEGARVLRPGPGAARLERDFVLPDGVGPDAVSATLDAGILTVALARPSREQRTIPVHGT